jgi:hypothetical protein
MCLPYRIIDDTTDKLSKREVNILMEIVKSDIQSLKYLNGVSSEFANISSIKDRERIVRKLKIMDMGC